MKTLHELLNSRYWAEYRDSIYSDMPFTDPERFDRVCAAAEHGADGSTHYEVIDDQRDALNDAESDGIITEETRDALLDELDAIEEFHLQQGSLHNEIG